MPRMNLYLSKPLERDLEALAARWGLSRSATIAAAVARALEEVGRGD